MDIDLAAIGVMVVFSIMGFVSGFTGRILSIASWITSVLVASHFFSIFKPFFHRLIQRPLLADFSAAATPFLISLIFFSLLSRHLADYIKKSKLGILDRNLGALLGLFLSLIFLSVLILLLRFLSPDTPAFVKESKFYGWLSKSADQMTTFIPMVLDPLEKKWPDPSSLEKKVEGYVSKDRASLASLCK